MTIDCILIDDEPSATEVLERLLKLYCPRFRVLCSCYTLLEGLRAVRRHRPAIAFLDIAMPGGSGIELASEIDPMQTKVIFITAYPDYSLNAFKVNAFDYLLKPVDPEDLQHAMARYLQLYDNEQAATPLRRRLIKLSDKDNTLFVEPEKIMYVKAQGRYSHIVLADQRSFTLTRNIGELEGDLPARTFLRPHKSYLVNVSCIDKISHKDGGFLVLANGVEIEIARRKRVEIIRRLSQPYS
ncbi:LytR/AlgR family response regulator transcription factor [Taibaiella koreensis]|uniref:LytR/AlgR family response regulator transcription factor n=1 Tax=Taibaiella koreensis TaxID=1268548 RepID=UPI000E59F0A9|nr:LytTR family DNA-binding domain-containing protein [Taibaiella koreensis]